MSGLSLPTPRHRLLAEEDGMFTEEDGMFTDRGYIAYKGYTSMEEVMNGSQSSHMEMGGLSR